MNSIFTAMKTSNLAEGDLKMNSEPADIVSLTVIHIFIELCNALRQDTLPEDSRYGAHIVIIQFGGWE